MFRGPGELAALVRSGELSAAELVGESLARIDALERFFDGVARPHRVDLDEIAALAVEVARIAP